jgi:hypothetical protein
MSWILIAQSDMIIFESFLTNLEAKQYKLRQLKQEEKFSKA